MEKTVKKNKVNFLRRLISGQQLRTALLREIHHERKLIESLKKQVKIEQELTASYKKDYEDWQARALTYSLNYHKKQDVFFDEISSQLSKISAKAENLDKKFSESFLALTREIPSAKDL